MRNNQVWPRIILCIQHRTGPEIPAHQFTSMDSWVKVIIVRNNWTTLGNAAEAFHPKDHGLPLAVAINEISIEVILMTVWHT